MNGDDAHRRTYHEQIATIDRTEMSGVHLVKLDRTRH